MKRAREELGRLKTLDQYNRDLEETRRLETLAGRARVAIDNADNALTSIARDFLRDAEALGGALGDLARFQSKSLAGEAPLDDIEYFADRIIEDADRELVAVERLERTLHRGGSDSAASSSHPGRTTGDWGGPTSLDSPRAKLRWIPTGFESPRGSSLRVT